MWLDAEHDTHLPLSAVARGGVTLDGRVQGWAVLGTAVYHWRGGVVPDLKLY